MPGRGAGPTAAGSRIASWSWSFHPGGFDGARGFSQRTAGRARGRAPQKIVWTSVVYTSIKGRMNTPKARNRAKARCFDSVEQEAFLNLWRTYDRLRKLEDELFAGHKLTA